MLEEEIPKISRWRCFAWDLLWGLLHALTIGGLVFMFLSLLAKVNEISQDLADVNETHHNHNVQLQAQLKAQREAQEQLEIKLLHLI